MCCLSTFSYAQNFIWNREATSGNNSILASTLSPSGEAYASVFNKNTSPSYYGENTILKYDTTGSQMWQFTISGNARVEFMNYDDGNLYIAGVFRDSLRVNQTLYTGAPFTDLSFIVLIDSNGAFQWAKLPWTSKRTIENLRIFNHQLYAVTLGAGWGSGTIAHFDINGNLLSEKGVSGSANISDFLPSGNHFYVAGFCNPNATFGSLTIPNTGSSYNSYILKTDSAFNPIWVDAAAHITFGFDSRLEMLEDTVYYFHGRKTANAGVAPSIFKYSQQGVITDSISFTDSWSPPFFHGLTKDTVDEDVLVLLSNKVSTGFGGFPLYFLDKELNVLRADTITNASTFSTTLSTSASGIYFSAKGNSDITYNGDTVITFAAGYGLGMVYFEYDTLRASFGMGVGDALLAKNEIRIFPNPTQQILHITYTNAEQQEVRVFNLSGRELNVPMVKNLSGITLDVSGISAGVYILKSNLGWVSRFVVK